MSHFKRFLDDAAKQHQEEVRRRIEEILAEHGEEAITEEVTLRTDHNNLHCIESVKT